MDCIQYRCERLSMDFYPQIFSQDAQAQLFRYLQENITFKTDRSSVMFGDDNETYSVTFQGQTTTKTLHPWDDLPALKAIRDYVSILLDRTFTCCLVKQYRTGHVGIAPHRDKELAKGT